MKKALFLLLILLLVSLFLASCGGSTKKPATPDDPSDTETVDDTDPTNQTDPTDTASNCGNHELDTGEVCDGDTKACSEIDPSYTDGYAYCKADCSGWDTTGCQGNQDPNEPTEDPEEPGEVENVFVLGPYFVNVIDVNSGTDGAPRQFRIYEPTGAEGKIPVIHFLHGFMYKIAYYDDMLIHLASHGFIVVSSQSDHAMMNGDTTTKEAEKLTTFLNWLKQNIQSKVSVTADVEHFGISGHSRGGKVSNRVLNSDPTIATSFFGVDPVDSAPPFGGFIGEDDPQSLMETVKFTGESMFLGTEKGPEATLGQSCAPSGDNSVRFYGAYPAPSHHIIAAGVGHADMVDPADVSACGMYCSTCKGSGNTALNQQFISYTGGLMAAFFNSTLKGQKQYENLINDSSQHPFLTTLNEHKYPTGEQDPEIEIGEALGDATMSKVSEGYFFDGPGTDEVMIFYPGASIEPTAYSSIMTMLAERGIDGFIIDMPADMAIFGQNKADDIYKNYPNYKKYYLSGHSMGGAMIANYAAKNIEKTSGLFMMAAYPTEDLKSAQFPILFIYGTEDGVLTRSKLETGLTLVPESAVNYEIEGGNHAYFGNYGEQDGDGTATIKPITQQKITVREILKLVR